MSGMVKKVIKTFTKPNVMSEGGGLSSLLVRRRINAKGAAVIIGAGTVIAAGNEGFKSHNISKAGRITYGGGPQRMTNSFTSGAVQAMHQVSGGNYAAFSDMAEEVVENRSIAGAIDNYGVTPNMIASLYNMGG